MEVIELEKQTLENSVQTIVDFSSRHFSCRHYERYTSFGKNFPLVSARMEAVATRHLARTVERQSRREQSGKTRHWQKHPIGRLLIEVHGWKAAELIATYGAKLRAMIVSSPMEQNLSQTQCRSELDALQVIAQSDRKEVKNNDTITSLILTNL
jgi:hypothetical protein